ncbi:MAG: autotransporter domain-containing protein [Pseudomonadota bacterium]|nr:autotransporter domain-containing protein [Pseudomonadota bacterium]
MSAPASFRRLPAAPAPSRLKPLAALLMGALVLAPLATGTARAADGLDDLGTLGGTVSQAYGVSADGSVVVGYADTGAAWHAFRWTSGGMVDLGTLGGTRSWAVGVSADGAVVVGGADTAGNAAYHAFRWTSGGMVDLGTLNGTHSEADGVSADGTVVVGLAYTAGDAAYHAFRWTSGGMADLGTLGGTNSYANGVSADGTVVVGTADTATASHAFRWTSGGMADLGTLGGTNSNANGVSADGAVVVGGAYTAGDAAYHAFRWTSGGMVDLGTLGGTNSYAYGVSADGSVVVGTADTTGNAASRAFRWTSGGMQSVEDWLRTNGVTVAADITDTALATNSDGSVVVGQLTNSHAFIARVAAVGSGMVTLADLQTSLGAAATGGGMALSTAGTVLNGAHSRPLARRVAAGKKAFWLAGDWGRDDHGARSGDLGLAEAGLGYNFGPAQVNVSLGQTWAQQNLTLNGQAKTDGTYLLAEALIPVAGNLWGTLGGYGHWGDADLLRGYLNAGAQDASSGKPGVDTWGLRARLDWDNAYRVAGADFSPYVDLTYSEAKLAAYTETGGGFPAQFDSRKDKATELRLGVNAVKPLDNGLNLVGTLEAAHRFEKEGARTSGQVIGLFGFDLAGADYKQDWLRAGVGIEGKLAEGRASLSLNVTTKGEAPNAWLAASWQKVF